MYHVASYHLSGFARLCDLSGHVLALIGRSFRVLGQRTSVDRVPVSGFAQRSQKEAQPGGAEDDQHPWVDDGVDGDEAQRDKVGLLSVALAVILHGINIHPDLQREEDKIDQRHRTDEQCCGLLTD